MDDSGARFQTRVFLATVVIAKFLVARALAIWKPAVNYLPQFPEENSVTHRRPAAAQKHSGGRLLWALYSSIQGEMRATRRVLTNAVEAR
jgi:hypothetical protein